MTVTVDSTAHTADATFPTADGYVPTNIVAADLSEPVGRHVTADTAAYSADNTIWPTADGGILGGAGDSFDALVLAADTAILAEAAAAADVLDATIEAAEAPVYGGARHYPPKPFPVIGVGYGILPPVRGEAHGVVIVAGVGAAVLPGFVGEAAGTAGVVGRSVAQLVVRAAAIGTRGQAGNAAAVLKGLSVASAGVVGTRGSGSGTIVKLQGAANGRHDDDEAAMMAFLLAA
jgi:hypothetical protein